MFCSVCFIFPGYLISIHLDDESGFVSLSIVPAGEGSGSILPN